MRIWVSCLLILLVMLATLSTAPVLFINDLNPFTNIFLLSPLFSVFMLILVVILLLLTRTLNQTVQAQSRQPTSKLVHALQAGVVLILTLTAGLHTLSAVKKAIATDITQPVRVLAKVRPIELNDSNFYPDSDMGYRQLAIIESAQPLTIAHLNSKANASNNTPNNTLNNTANNVSNNNVSNNDASNNSVSNNNASNNNSLLPELEGKTVLLNARFNSLAKNSHLPAGFSKDFSGLNKLQPTQTTTLMLSLQPIAKEEKGFIHRWLRSRHVNAQGTVLAYHKDFTPVDDGSWRLTLHQWRWQLREHFLHNFNNAGWQNLANKQQQAQAVTLSLLTGDRALIDKETKYLYQLSGISHLLAISGTHVLFLAIMLTALVIAVVNKTYPMLYQYVPRSQLRWLVMVIGALLYALFTGFDVPSARTVYMLTAVGLCRLLLLEMSARQVLLIVAVLMAIVDPYVLWQAGFWLSFVAVMLLISYEVSVSKSAKEKQLNITDFTNFIDANGMDIHERGNYPLMTHFTRLIMPFIKLQLWMFIALLPLSLLLFGKVSLWGVLVNMFAIALYGWIVVPINLLAGLFYLVIPSIADGLWRVLTGLLVWLHDFLGWLVGVDTPSQSWLYTDINAGIILIIMLACLPMLLPNKAISKIWSFPPLLLLAMLLMNQNNFFAQNSLITVSDDSAQEDISVRLLDTPLIGRGVPISSIVISYGDDNWLVVAEHPKYQKKQNKNATQNDINNLSKKISNIWLESLAKSGVSSLTGVIVQTPSLNLMKSSEMLKQGMPVGYLWQAGNKYLNPSSKSALSCTVGRNWTSEDGRLSIKAMTGWQDINDKDVWSCALQINGLAPIITNSQYPVQWMSKQKNEDKTTPPIAQQLIINSGNVDDKSWKLWQMLCLSADDTVENKQSLFLSHSHDSSSGLPIELTDEQPVNNWLLIDKPNQYNQQKLNELTLDWAEK